MAALSGTSALVTGGGSGIGLGCAARLVADGAEITVGRAASRWEHTAKELGCRRLRRGPDYSAMFSELFEELQAEFPRRWARFDPLTPSLPR